MKYTLVFGDRQRETTLGGGVSRHSVAAECRVAALELVNARTFDAAALARWLVGPYARATRHTFHGDRVAGIGVTAEVPRAAIEALIADVRRDMLAALSRASAARGFLDVAGEAIDRGHVVRARDAAGGELWLPVDHARMKLRERVRSLFAADYANDPRGYADLVVCRTCEAAVFDAVAKEHGLCAAHRRVSGIDHRRAAASARRVSGER